MNLRSGHGPYQPLRTILGGLLALGAVALALILFSLSHSAAAADSEPDVEVSADTLQLAPGDTLGIKVQITNPFTATLASLVVKFDYDSSQLTPIGSEFQRDSDWVSELSDSRVTITFQDIGAGKSRSGRVLFRVNQPAPGNTSVAVHARYNWQTKSSDGLLLKDGSGSDSGADALIVAPDGVLTNPSVIDSAPRVAISPGSGGAGTLFRAYASGFSGGERVSIWLNTPTGAAAVPHELFANDSGEVWPEFSSAGFAPGSYGLVIYGQESTQTLVVPFAVGASAAPPGPAVPPPPAPSGISQPSHAAPRHAGPTAAAANIEPRSAPAGTLFRAYAGGFQGGEAVSIWLNAPGGVVELNATFTAGATGEVWPEFTSDGLAPGSYGLVIYGQSSGQTVVVPFSINPYS